MILLTHKGRVALLSMAILFVVAPGVGAFAQYTQTNLVSTRRDANLINGWGLAYLPTSPFWVSDNGTGRSSIYNSAGNRLLVVTVPPAKSGMGSPTGMVANTTSGFVVSQNSKSGSALFIFDSLDGTISGWNPNVNPGSAVIAVNNNASGDMYTGLAIITVTTSTGPQTLIAAADAAHNQVKIYNSRFKFVRSFRDPHTPTGLSVYGIETINGKFYVTLGSLTPNLGGAVDIFDVSGTLIKRFTTSMPGGVLNGPWGLAKAPSNFKVFSNALLVGNVGSGQIVAFNATTGNFLGVIKNTSGHPITISGLWALRFGGGDSAVNGNKNQLFFTAGPNAYLSGLFGVIQ
jgi:uncharacterized protein (TIGR03118 family)